MQSYQLLVILCTELFKLLVNLDTIQIMSTVFRINKSLCACPIDFEQQFDYDNLIMAFMGLNGIYRLICVFFPQLLKGEYIGNKAVQHWLDPPFVAQHVQFNPQSSFTSGRVCMRVDIYGCYTPGIDCINTSLGLLCAILRAPTANV